MTIGDKAELGPGLPIRDDLANDLARDLDLRDAVDLAPHAVRDVVDEDRPGSRLVIALRPGRG